MQPHEKLAKLLSKVEAVEWLYDGLNGKIIPWTKEHGGTSDDPSVQAFVVARDGKVLARCPDGKAYSASGFAQWLEEELGAYERVYPRTAFRFERPDMDLIDGRPASESFLAARKSGKPILLYVSRSSAGAKDRRAKKEVKACRKLERGALSSKKAAKAAEGWVLFQVDLSQEREARWAKSKGIEQAPRLLVYLPGEKTPLDVTRKPASSLAYLLEKHAP